MLASTDIHSGAFSFNSFIQTGTDTRTGLYTATLTLPPLCSGALSGPDLPLSVSYSPLNNADSGFGLGWALAVSRYAGQHLSLHTGESFRITGSGDEPDIEERRLLTFRFMKEVLDGIPGWRVVHRSGVTEHLRDVSGDGVFLPVRVTSQEGRAITLDWGQFSGAPFLRSVTDGEGRVLMRAAREGGVMQVTLHPVSRKAGIPAAAAPAVWTFHFTGQSGSEELRRVLMPDGVSGWTFDYDTLRGTRCITAVTTPTGAEEDVVYGDDGHEFPGGGRPALPRVTRVDVRPGAGQPDMITRYEYADEDRGVAGNFLGLGATGIDWRDDGLDNLYRAEGAYRYLVKEIREAGDTRIVTTRVYNRFHLMVEEEAATTQTLPDGSGKPAPVTTLKSTLTDFHDDESLSFARQVAWYQMPAKVTRNWYCADNVGKIRTTTEVTEYNASGNLIRHRDVSGTVTEQEWYPADGSTAADGTVLCPPDPQGFERALARRTLHPALERDPALSPRDAAVVTETRFRYERLPPAEGGDSDWLSECEVTLHEGTGSGARLLKTTTRSQVNAPADLTRHGMPLRVTETLAGQAEDNVIAGITDYEYERQTRDTLPVLRTTTRRYSAQLRGDGEAGIMSIGPEAVSISDNLLSQGDPVHSWPDEDTEVHYVYDDLGRLSEEGISPGTDWAATRHYEYGVRTEDNSNWTVRRRAQDGAASRTWYDGLGRVVRDEQQDMDNREHAFRPVASVVYDGLGREAVTTLTDWEEDRDVTLTTRVAFDAWGARYRVTAPDGTVSVTLADPVTLTEETWTEGTDEKGNTVMYGRVRTVTDEAGNTLSVTPLSADGKTELPGKTWRYDGYGHLTLETDERGYETRHAVDALGRPVCTTLADESQVITTYAPQSEKALVASLTIQPGNGSRHRQLSEEIQALRDDARAARGRAGRQAITLARQTFDGLDRPVSLTAGTLTRTLSYEGASARVQQQIRPSGRALNYVYEPKQTDEPKSILGEGTGGAEFTYHPKTARLTGSLTPDRLTQRHYLRDGRDNLKQVTYTDGSDETVTTLTYSREGQLLKRQSGSGPQEVHTWSLGRPASVSAGGLSERYIYSAGMLKQSVRSAPDGEMVLDYEYDEQGRETSRTVTTAQGEVKLVLTWGDDGRLARRERQQDGVTVLTEGFGYDERGRLESWMCEAEEEVWLPRSPYGHPVVRQLMTHDALDNVELCRTTFRLNGQNERNDATFIYDVEGGNPDRLKSLSHSHAAWPLRDSSGREVPEVTFTWDDDGNMTTDECGRSLTYDAQGRLETVCDGDGELLRYRYDGNGHLAGVWHRDEEDEERREWSGYRLLASRRGEEAVYYLHGDDAVGEEHWLKDGEHLSRLYVTDAGGSITGEQEAGDVRQVVYGVYGTRDEYDEEHKAGLKTALGFTGEVRERGPGWYLPGNGYRVYNPVLMRFHSPDSESPLGDGGLNRYVYGLSDPVNIHDPSGHLGAWMSALAWTGAALGAIGLAVSIVGLPASVGVLGTATAAALGSSSASAALSAGAAAAGGVVATTVAAAAVDVVAVGLGVTAEVTGLISLAQLEKTTTTNKTLEKISLATGIGSLIFGGFGVALNRSLSGTMVRDTWKGVKTNLKGTSPATDLLDEAVDTGRRSSVVSSARDINQNLEEDFIRNRFSRDVPSDRQVTPPSSLPSSLPSSPPPQRTILMTARDTSQSKKLVTEQPAELPIVYSKIKTPAQEGETLVKDIRQGVKQAQTELRKALNRL